MELGTQKLVDRVIQLNEKRFQLAINLKVRLHPHTYLLHLRLTFSFIMVLSATYLYSQVSVAFPDFSNGGSCSEMEFR